MTGRGIGQQAIGMIDAQVSSDTPRGKPAVFMFRTDAAALFAPKAIIDARYTRAQEIAAPFTHHTDCRAIWSVRHILHIETDKKDSTTMHTHIHGNIEARSGEPVEIAFNVTDKDGNAIDLTLATAEYRLARRAGDTALLSCSSAGDGGITAEGNIATVTFDSAALTQNGQPMLGDFYGQLRITLDSRTLVVAEGPISIAPVILPAP